jgi:hypothetical protein
MRARASFAFAFAACAAASAHGASGVVEINQARALAGGVTASDTAGFPVTIDVRGSYHLTSDLVRPDVGNAIAINADDVSLDLEGFTVSGPVTCSGAPVTSCSATLGSSGILGSTRSNVTIRNGTLRGFSGSGISLGSYARIEEVVAIGNGSNGILVGAGSSVRSSLARGNFVDGIGATEGAAVSGSVALDNGDDGIVVGAGSAVRSNASRNNGGDGYVAGTGSLLADNGARDNGDDGLEVSTAAAVLRNTALGNADFGMLAGASGTSNLFIAGNVATGNNAGAQCEQVPTDAAFELAGNSCAGDSRCPPTACLPPAPPTPDGCGEEVSSGFPVLSFHCMRIPVCEVVIGVGLVCSYGN